MEPEQSLEIISKENKFLQLPAPVDDIIGAMELYQDLLTKLLTDNDYATIKDKKCIKKSGWLKLALAFNLSLKIIEEKKEIDPEDSKHYSYHITVECIAPNGRVTSELGTCDTVEKNENEHVIRTMAMTRAKSRAIASMIGASESSAEEMESVKSISSSPPTPLSPPTEEQLQTLKNLGYTGPKPESKLMASNIIQDKKEDAKVAETTVDTTSQESIEAPTEEMDWCECNEPKPKYEKDENNMHICYDCTKPVKTEDAAKLLKNEEKA